MLHQHYASDPIPSHYGILEQILDSQFPEAHFQDAFAKWELYVARWERDTGVILPDAVKIGILRVRTSGALQKHLKLGASCTAAYADVRASLLGYYRSLSPCRTRHTPYSRSYTGTNHSGPSPKGIHTGLKGVSSY